LNSASAVKPQIVKLDKSHSTDAFNCGATPLNVYLQRFALVNQSAGGAQTYAAVVNSAVIGYYSLSTGSVEYDHAPERTRKGLARYPVPVILIARLAVDRTWQGKGLGAALLLDALRRVVSAADVVGVRAVLVHAKDEPAKRFYEHFDFDPSPVDPMHLFLLVKEIARLTKNPGPSAG
jgi:GNAT superfamily N-acetyltransferase